MTLWHEFIDEEAISLWMQETYTSLYQIIVGLLDNVFAVSSLIHHVVQIIANG